MKLTKKKVFVMALAVCLIAILSFGSLAWFNASDSVTNTFKVADSDDPDNLPDFDVEIFETDEDGNEVDGKEYPNLLPGAELDKDPTVRNTGDYDMYTRVTVTLSDAATWLTASQKYDLTGEKDDIEVFESLVTINSDWIRYAGPYVDLDADTITYVYYYNGVVAPDAVTSPVFNKVTIPDKLTQEDMDYGTDATFTVDVKAEAIQAENIIPEGSTLTQIDSFQAFAYANWNERADYGA